MNNLAKPQYAASPLRDKEIVAVINELNKTILGLSQLLKSLNELLELQKISHARPKQLH